MDAPVRKKSSRRDGGKKSRSHTSADRTPVRHRQPMQLGRLCTGPTPTQAPAEPVEASGQQAQSRGSSLARAIGRLILRTGASGTAAGTETMAPATSREGDGARVVHAHRYTDEPSVAWEMLKARRPVKPVRPMPLDTPVRRDAVRFVCVSCTHNGAVQLELGGGSLDDDGGRGLAIPDGDVLLVGGDFTSMGLPEEVRTFDDALGRLPHAVKVVVAGHKEYSLDESFIKAKVSSSSGGAAAAGGKDAAGVRQAISASLGAQRLTTARSLFTNAVYLQDDLCDAFDLAVYGAPWLPLSDSCGAFGLARGKQLLDKWNLIPSGVDVLLTHGPPLGHGDTNKEQLHVGDVELLNTVCKRVRPKYHVFGHVHQGYGCTTDGYTKYINSSVCDSRGRRRHKPIIFDVPVDPAHKQLCYAQLQHKRSRTKPAPGAAVDRYIGADRRSAAMSANPSSLGGAQGSGPDVQFRAAVPTYGTGPGDADAVPVDPAANGINSTNQTDEQLAPRQGGFKRRKIDKTPLLHSDSMNEMAGGSLAPVTNPHGLSTFSGVFAPVALSMFSVLLFLRMGFVVGQAGVWLTLLQLVIAYGIVLLTVLSLCAISTNGALESGGVYYMISRALGPEFGGAIGLLFFLANVFSCALYLSGFTEVLLSNFGPNGYSLPDDSAGVLPDSYGFRLLYGCAAALLMLLVLMVGSGAFAKLSVAFLALLALCYANFVCSCLFSGAKQIAIPKTDDYVYTWLDDNGTQHRYNETQYRNYTGLSAATFAGNTRFNGTFTHDYTTNGEMSFATVFAIVFSGVTGIMAGANMSGELKQPSVAIPKGTLQAVGATFLVTLPEPVKCPVKCLLSCKMSKDMVNVPLNGKSREKFPAKWQTKVCHFAGHFPRLPTPMTFDISPGILHDPRVTPVYVLTTFLLGATCTRELLQNNNVVAQEINYPSLVIVLATLVTTFYAAMSNLLGASRVMLRLAEDRIFGDMTSPLAYTVGNRNPVFSVLLAWLLVVGMLAIGSLNRIAKIASIFFLLSYMGVNLACLALDLASAPNFRVWDLHQVRKYLLLLDVRKEHIKYWRPQMLLMVKSPSTCAPLIDFVNDLKKSGLYVIGHVRGGTLDDFSVDPLHENYPFWLSLVDYLKVKAFVELTLAPSVRHGVAQLARLAGLGAMKPNTVVVGFPHHQPVENTLDQSKLLKKLKFAKLERQEVVEYFTASQLPPAAPSSSDSGGAPKLSASEYVSMLVDVLKLNKNLVVARHFDKFDKADTFQASSRTAQYIDVWPVDVVRPTETSFGWDNSCLFVLQLACILNMSHGWKTHTKLRVFLCVNSLQDMQRRERQLRQVLSQLRIKARSLVVPWDHVVCHLAPQADSAEDIEPVGNAADLPHAYVAALNDMIKRHSANSAVVFVNLPPPPAEASSHERYLGVLSELSAELPPTVMVHGLSSVISTAL